jgi:transcriptional regulator with XRE-family HTH domain
LTREELANLLGTTRQTLTNWEKEKPDLIRLINQGLALDDSIEETKRHLEKLEELKNAASSGKLRLK